MVVPPEHSLAKRDWLKAEELEGENLVGFTADLQMRTETDKWLKQAKVHVNVVHAFDNIENIKRAVEVGSGIALLPVPTVRREAELGSLVAIPLEDVTWFRRLALIHKRTKPFTTAITRFLELLQQDPETFSGPGQSHDAAGSRNRSVTDAASQTKSIAR